MKYDKLEKRQFPRLDTSSEDTWKIRVFGLKGRPLEGRILNLSLGGVAFIGHWREAARTVKRFTTKVEIQTPDGHKVNANSSLVRILPGRSDDECLCVLKLDDMSNNHSLRLRDQMGLN